jgi:hypothetical protein
VRSTPSHCYDEAQDAALPPEFTRLCELLEQFDAEVRRALDPQELRLLELRWGLFAPSGRPTPTLDQTASEKNWRLRSGARILFSVT